MKSLRPDLVDLVLLAVIAAVLFVPAGTAVVTPACPVDRVVAVYESCNQSVAEASVMAGVTVQSIDKAGKWRQYDKNEIPESMRAVLQPVVDRLGVPCLCLIRGGAAVASAKFQASDAELSAFVQSHGGF